LFLLLAKGGEIKGLRRKEIEEDDSEILPVTEVFYNVRGLNRSFKLEPVARETDGERDVVNKIFMRVEALRKKAPLEKAEALNACKTDKERNMVSAFEDWPTN